MITVIEGNIFDSQCQTLVNPVNCIGVMGRGLALEFKQKYPDMFTKYKNICDRKLLEPGKLWLYKTQDKWILCFPTKDVWWFKSRYEYIEKGLDKFVESYKDKKITSIAFPMLGCANGQLNEEKVFEIMKNKLEKCVDIEIEIYRNPPKP